MIVNRTAGARVLSTNVLRIGVILPRMLMQRSGRIGVAENQCEAAVRGLEHEACGNERPQEQHCQHKRHRPVPRTADVP